MSDEAGRSAGEDDGWVADKTADAVESMQVRREATAASEMSEIDDVLHSSETQVQLQGRVGGSGFANFAAKANLGGKSSAGPRQKAGQGSRQRSFAGGSRSFGGIRSSSSLVSRMQQQQQQQPGLASSSDNGEAVPASLLQMPTATDRIARMRADSQSKVAVGNAARRNRRFPTGLKLIKDD